MRIPYLLRRSCTAAAIQLPANCVTPTQEEIEGVCACILRRSETRAASSDRPAHLRHNAWCVDEPARLHVGRLAPRHLPATWLLLRKTESKQPDPPDGEHDLLIGIYLQRSVGVNIVEKRAALLARSCRYLRRVES